MNNSYFRWALCVLLLAVGTVVQADAPGQGFIIRLQSAPALDVSANRSSRIDHLQARYTHLRAHAQTHQADMTAWLDARGVDYRAYWIVNAILVFGDAELRAELAQRTEVKAVVDNTTFRAAFPSQSALDSVQRPQGSVPWNLSMIEADQVWALGNTGEGVVVASADTGVFPSHSALLSRYRGYQDGQPSIDDYNWFDGYCDGAACGSPLLSPADPHGHGTHTVGTMVGGSPGDTVGVAPGAQWIGCRNMDAGGNGTPATYLSCFEWFMAPTTVTGAMPNPALAPHIVNNSWGCPPSEGCDAAQTALLEDAVEALIAAGIVVVVAAGNSGSSCGSVDDPPAMLDASLTVGSVTSSETISSFSSRGPAAGGSGDLLKPEIVAPGSGIRSTVTSGGYATWNGTSMAAPHIAGVAALMIAQDPSLASDPLRLQALLEGTAVPRTSSQGCGGLGSTVVPNHVYGHGRVDALQAVIAADTLFFYDFD